METTPLSKVQYANLLTALCVCLLCAEIKILKAVVNSMFNIDVFDPFSSSCIINFQFRRFFYRLSSSKSIVFSQLTITAWLKTHLIGSYSVRLHVYFLQPG